MNTVGASSLACFATCLLLSASLGGESAADPTEMAGLVAEADHILIGKPPTEVRMAGLSQTLEVKGPPVLTGYRIEPVRFLRGAAQRQTREGYPFVSLPLTTSGHPGGAEVPIQLPPGDVPQSTYIYFLRLKRAAYGSFCKESPVRPQGWFLPATAENVQAVEAALPMPEEWGPVSEGLRLGIRSNKSTYKTGAAIRIDVYLQNAGEERLVIPQHRLAAEDYYPFTYFQACNYSPSAVQDDARLHRVRPALSEFAVFEKPVGLGQKNVLPLVTLSPGETHCETVRLESWQWQTRDANSPFRPGATWVFKAWFQTTSIPKELRYRAHEREMMWRGALESNRIDIAFR